MSASLARWMRDVGLSGTDLKELADSSRSGLVGIIALVDRSVRSSLERR